ncbi:MAG: hypothetical protein QM680_03080 [Luteolibacter sp.]
MHLLLRKPLVLAAAFAFTVLSAGSAFGQAAKATIEKPAFDDLPSPEFSGGKQKDFKPKNWIDVEAKVRIQMAPEPATKVCDKVEVVWYVAAANPDKAGSYYKIRRKVTYMNVPLNEDVYFSVYLSPSALKRLTGSADAGKRAVKMIGLEVLVNGQKVGESANEKPGWWNVASDKISETNVVKLLDKSETPFSNMWWDRYPEIDPTAPKAP